LNFKCQTCKKNLCKDHYHNEYSCSEYDLLSDNSKNNRKIQPKEEMIKCNFCEVQVYSSLINICKSCQLKFCNKHRLEADHSCKIVKIPLKEKFTQAKNSFMEKLNKMKKEK